MTEIIALSGSLRRGSFNTGLLRALAEAAPAGVQVEVVTLHGIPLYDGDLEAEQGLPEAVRTLKDRIVAADGLLIGSPEYNNGVPGVLKNAIDWLSRPASDLDRVFGNRPVALVGATPGRGGTLLAQAAWLPILRALNAHAWFGPRLVVSSAGQAFDSDGHLKDEALRAQLGPFLAGFAAFIHQGR